MREFILNRDDYKCCMCNRDLLKASPITRAIHHILPRQYKELFFDDMNLILLCSSCHHWHKTSPHQNALYFSLWLNENKKEQYEYLIKKLKEVKSIS